MSVSSPVSHVFTSQRLKLHYVDWGNPAAPPLLLVHGGRDHARSWDAVAQGLCTDWHVIAVDLRGHGDSSWTSDGNYEMNAFVFDLAELIDQLELAPVTIIAHSLGGSIATRYAGLYPNAVRKLINIEGLGPSPTMLAERETRDYADTVRGWIAAHRQASQRTARRYASFEEARSRMKAANTFLSDAQAHHLTLHGANENDDGTWSWKFDPLLNIWSITTTPRDTVHALWRAVTCPVLLVYGAKSWASNPANDGRISSFQNARVVEFSESGHWVHHDELTRFMAESRDFLTE